ncbi:hypothetical protein ACFX19_015180 [Malus domestica]
MISSVGIDNTVAVESADLAVSSVGIDSTASRATGYLSKSRLRRTSESLLVEVISSAFSANYFMIGYSQVGFRVRHFDGRTTFTVKTYIRFEYLCPYTLVSIRREFTMTNTIPVTETNDDDLTQETEMCSFLGRNRKTQKSAAHQTQHQHILLLGRTRSTSWHALHSTEGCS